MSCICVVCKTPIDDVLVVQSDKGPVHPGQCYNHAVEMPVTENTEQQLNEVQLLIQCVTLLVILGSPYGEPFLYLEIRSSLLPRQNQQILIQRVYRPKHHEQ